MSELREECYKCLNNQSCPGAADYGSILCMTKRKYKMPGNEEDSIYAHKFAIMQKQIDEKEAKIKDLEQQLEKANNQLDLDYVDKNYIPKQKVKEGLEDIEDYFDRLNGPDEDIEYIRNIKKNLLEDKQ